VTAKDMSGAALSLAKVRHGRGSESPEEEQESHEGIGLRQGVTSAAKQRTFRRSKALKSDDLIEG
jgi:hypothetical protein